MVSRGFSRLGGYRRNAKGIPLFHTRKITSNIEIEIDAEMASAIEKASHSVGKLVGSSQLLPNPEHFVYMYLRLEALISSRIEGTQASLMDLLQYEQERVEKERDDDLVQVSNHLEILQTLVSRKRRAPLGLDELIKLHAQLMRDTRGHRAAGRLRHQQNWIGSGGPIEEASFVPPPPGEVKPAMLDLLKFVHEERDLPPLLVSAVAHAQFETIHPFLDGNGRMGRFLIHYILWQRSIVEQPILYLSHYLRRRQADYYTRLQATRDNDELEEWCLMFLEGVTDVAVEALERSRLVIAAKTEMEAAVRADLGRRAGTALQVLERMYQQPVADVRQIAEWTGMTATSANTLAAELTKAGVFSELTGQKRNRRFAITRYLAFFTALDEADDPRAPRGGTGRTRR